MISTIKTSSVFFVPDSSSWPILVSLNIFNLFMILLFWSENFIDSALFIMYFLIFNWSVFSWTMDVKWEMESGGLSSLEMDNTFKLSMIWFIGSEAMFFFSFFFSYFSLSISPEPSTGLEWPPLNISPLSPSLIPLLNTLILLSSGLSLTWCHYLILAGERNNGILAMSITLFLSAMFSSLQALEYMASEFSLNDSFYGNIFFLSTGFHGAHVLLGSIFLLFSLYHMLAENSCASGNHVFLEMSSWYWHFVDVVWLLLFLSVYCGSAKL